MFNKTLTPFEQFQARLEADPDARQFVAARRAGSTNAKAIVEAVQLHVQHVKRWRRDAWETRKLAVEAFMCDLLHRRLTAGDDATIHAATDNTVKRTRYTEVFTGRPQREAIEALVELAHAEQANEAAKPVRQATFRVGPALASLLQQYPVTVDDFYRCPGEEIHIQRGYKINGRAPLIDYDDVDVPPLVADLRMWLRKYNDYLEAADITCALPDIDLSDRRLFRIFNNKSFSEGGRLYRGFWQTMRSDDRHTIQIEGRPIVQLDYRATMLTLAYGEVKAELPGGDPYLVPGLEDYRRGVKRLTVAMLCVKRPLSAWPAEIAEDFRGPDGFLVDTLPNLRDRIREAHAPLADLFETGSGLRLMWLESQILIDVLNACKRRGIVALPVHDCVCVRADRAVEVAELMSSFFEAHSGVRTAVEWK